MPLFADHRAGWSCASFGYVVGFVVAAAVVGALAELGLDRTPLSAAFAMAIGSVFVYACGVPVLMAALDIDLTTGLSAGVQPFLLGDVLKIVAAAGVLPAAWELVGRVRTP